MIHMVELFAGIGAQATAMEELGLEHESVVCEIDEYAYRSYCAIHGETPNLGDITKVEHLPDCDLFRLDRQRYATLSKQRWEVRNRPMQATMEDLRTHPSNAFGGIQ